MDSADSSDFVWNCDVPRVQDLDLWSVHLVSNCTHSDRSKTAKIHTFSPPRSCLASLLFVHFQGPRCDDAFTCNMKPSRKSWINDHGWYRLIVFPCFLKCIVKQTGQSLQQMQQHAVLPELPHPNLLGKFAIAANYEASPQTDLDNIGNFYITYM